MQKCDFCGEEAKYQFKNGKWCCKKYWTSCKGGKKILSKSQNKQTTKNKKSESMKYLHQGNEEFQKNYKEGKERAKLKMQRPENRKRSSDNRKRILKNEEFRKFYAKSLLKDLNKDEERVFNLLKGLFNGYFEYNYGDKFKVANYRPDFFNRYSKVAVDYMGTFWHERKIKKQKTTRLKYINKRKREFKKMGWNLCVIWGTELNDMRKLVSKLIKFVERV